MKSSLVVIAALSITACKTGGEASPGYFADMRSTSGVVLGRIIIQAERTGGIRMTGDLTALPQGEHGIHFHSVGRCDVPEFTTAGGHFNPATREHGLENPSGPHAGDWPNLFANTSGAARLALSTTRLTLDAHPASGIIDADGTAIVIHAARDDQQTDPSGNSGARIACGVITRR